MLATMGAPGPNADHRGPDHPRHKPLTGSAGRAHFAGGRLGCMDAWQHGAFSSARGAVTAIHRRVPA